MGDPATPDRGLQVQHRPGTGTQDPRRRRPVPGTARQRGGGKRCEKSQVQALDRTAPMLPLRPGLAERRTHDYVRHGTTTLFAALEVATGKITADACYPRHRSDEFLAFLKTLAKAHPRVPLHVVVDNYATHNHPRVKTWLQKNP